MKKYELAAPQVAAQYDEVDVFRVTVQGTHVVVDTVLSDSTGAFEPRQQRDRVALSDFDAALFGGAGVPGPPPVSFDEFVLRYLADRGKLPSGGAVRDRAGPPPEPNRGRGR